jgi:thiol-disulfide isomerase/thioredoxin
MSKVRTVVGISIFLLLGTLGFGGESDSPSQFSLNDTHGNTQNIGKYKGKIVVLNFWATWCTACRHEMPLLAEMQKKYQDKDVVVLGAAVDDEKTQPLVQPFAEKNKIPFPLLVGATSDQMKQLQLGEAIPATAFFDADGNLIGRVLGELQKSDLQKRLEWMLGNHHGNPPSPLVNEFEKKKPESTPSIFSH